MSASKAQAVHGHGESAVCGAMGTVSLLADGGDVGIGCG
jgi:hypothetical protein